MADVVIRKGKNGAASFQRRAEQCRRMVLHEMVKLRQRRQKLELKERQLVIDARGLGHPWKSIARALGTGEAYLVERYTVVDVVQADNGAGR